MMIPRLTGLAYLFARWSMFNVPASSISCLFSKLWVPRRQHISSTNAPADLPQFPCEFQERCAKFHPLLADFFPTTEHTKEAFTFADRMIAIQDIRDDALQHPSNVIFLCTFTITHSYTQQRHLCRHQPTLHHRLPDFAMSTFSLGVPLDEPTPSTALTNSCPSITSPKTQCFPLR